VSNPNAAPLVFYIHADHLNAPRIVLDQNGAKRWRWIAEPFGTTAPESNPDGHGAFTQNLRFPGQYADAESGLWYNYFRSYDSSKGGYTQPDPLGLAAGINSYSYVKANPLSRIDPLGLIDSIDARIDVAIVRQDLAALTDMIEAGGLSPAQEVAVQQRLRTIDILKNGIANESRLAELMGKSRKEIGKAIHLCKNKMRAQGMKERNPDIIVDPRNGEVYFKFQNGRLGESIGNIFDYL
jgi:RHS repeat-associated protein